MHAMNEMLGAGWSMYVVYVLSSLIVVGLLIDVALMLRLGFKRVRHQHTALPLRHTPWDLQQGTAIGLMLLFFNVSMTAAVTALYELNIFTLQTLQNAAMVLQTLLFHIAALVLIYVILKSMRLSWKHAFGFTSHGLPRLAAYAIAFYLAAMPVVGAAEWVSRTLLTDFGYPMDSSDVQDVVRVFVDPCYPAWIRIYMAVFAALIGPCAEEFLFRGVGLPILARYTGKWTAILLSSLIFAVMHLHVPSIAPLFVISVAFSCAYVYSGSIMVPIIMHIVFNTVNISALMSKAGAAAGLLP